MEVQVPGANSSWGQGWVWMCVGRREDDKVQKAKTMELVVQLGLGLLLVAGHCIPATAAPSSACQMQCGDVKILYPFGIGKNCSVSGEFDVTCQPDKNGISKPFIGGHELLDISLTNSTIRVLNPITTYCYNDTWHMNSSMVVEQQNDSSGGYTLVATLLETTPLSGSQTLATSSLSSGASLLASL
ncbi:unnamed protein product [Miscanthus lutarioriparius]|uniref:Wall-associated receptor kinase galacturonan-binding domain-containing protein n=1 Tax=Miscanthus lutarioriparius TaxID=422564 RepID=A0A811NDS8_9POAL|nr:unnamed protein product [Miscanthus lutarioriparius]